MSEAKLKTASEAKLKTALIKKLRQKYQGCFIRKISDRWQSGLPDLFLLWNGAGIWIELKTETGVVSDIQKYTIRAMREQGGNVFICRSVAEAISAVESSINKEGTC